MLEFICYFMPSFISLNIYKNLVKMKDLKQFIIHYGIFVSLNNLFTLLIVMIKNLDKSFEFSMISVTYCFKYLFFSIIFSIIMPYIIQIINRNIEINVEVKKNEKSR